MVMLALAVLKPMLSPLTLDLPISKYISMADTPHHCSNNYRACRDGHGTHQTTLSHKPPCPIFNHKLSLDSTLPPAPHPTCWTYLSNSNLKHE